MTFIGIDPDVSKSGVALAEDGKIQQLHTMDFWTMIDFLDANPEAHIVIEAGWLNKSVWHPSKNQSTAAKIGTYVGANWQVGKLLEEYCNYMGRTYNLVKPTKSKIEASEFKLYTGWTKRTNSEERDAAMLIVGRV